MRAGELAPLPGNQQVIDMLETALEYARQGDITYGAIALLQYPNKMLTDFIGTVDMDEPAEQALELLKRRIIKSRKARALPPRDLNLTADHVCYDLTQFPCNYDIYFWLIDAEMTRKRENAPAPLKVAFWYGAGGVSIFEMAATSRIFEGVVKPMLKLVGAVEDPAALLGRAKPFFNCRNITMAIANGEKPPSVTASDEGKAFIKDWLNRSACNADHPS